ncbi:MAG: Type 1 glutamine amidotransferase-like domain-containing protein [Patescibacteria group bacterium]
MKKIVAIGGGEIGKPGYPVETTKIDKEIIQLTGKKNPMLLFIPTASSDSESYFKVVKKHFGKRLGCKTDVLYLIEEKPTRKEIEEKILNSDIIYVGGGNTLKMMKVWRNAGVDKILKQAYNKGVILSGLSAGSICWFDSGHSDSMSFYNPKKRKYINVKGLGLIRGIHCPHYNGRTLKVPRRKHFQNMIKKIGGFGIAIENNCAIEFIDNKYFKVITSKPHAGAYKVYKKRGEIISEKIEQKAELSPIRELFLKGDCPLKIPFKNRITKRKK